MKLVIVHYHLRPGGIRRVIELGATEIVRQFQGKIQKVIVLTGEAREQWWNDNFQSLLAPVPLEIRCETSVGYLSEQKVSLPTVRRELRAVLTSVLAEDESGPVVVWAHNLGIARNLLLTRELLRAAAARHVPVIAHHHDWWFDNRWIRWPEMRRSGFRTLTQIARTVFPPAPEVRHIAINQCDARILERHFDGRAGWLPNLTEPAPMPSKARQRVARRWLAQSLGDARAPVWILPCRLLRRKNVAEALLLARWLRPEAWLVTTGGFSSADEMPYFERLQSAARENGWRLRLGLLQGAKADSPSVLELLAVSETVLLTSIQEGFGLPYLEAAAANRPLIARKLANVSPDLEAFGFRFPQCYDDILVSPNLFDWAAESKRQAGLYRAWKAQLPRECRRRAGEPVLMEAGATPTPVPFSRLTLTAQLEVLAQPAERSWKLSAPLNSFLVQWRKRAAVGRLQRTPWPRQAARWLSGRAYARRFAQILRQSAPTPASAAAGLAAQGQFIHERLEARNLFPLLWSRDS